METLPGEHSMQTDAGEEAITVFGPEADDVNLPPAPPGFSGFSGDEQEAYTISVSNASGYLCHITMECHFTVPPHVIFRIFTNPDNSHLFRDIKRIVNRKVLYEDEHKKIVEVEQTGAGEFKVLWMRNDFTTFLKVTEDSSDPSHLRMHFHMIKSDLLSRFEGTWVLQPEMDGNGVVCGTRAVLEQDVLPRGVPSFFKHLPLLGGLLRSISVRASKRMVEDIQDIVKQVQGGKSLDEVLQAGPDSASLHVAPLAAHPLVLSTGESDEE